MPTKLEGKPKLLLVWEVNLLHQRWGGKAELGLMEEVLVPAGRIQRAGIDGGKRRGVG